MGEFRAEKFHLSLLHHDGGTERVVVQIGLDGLKIMANGSDRVMRSYDLSHISRWQSKGSSLILYTRTPVDVEERQTTLQGGDSVIRSALDTLTCCCMQLAELLQSKQTDTATETANNLHALVSGGGKKKSQLPMADEVEYWKKPEKEGWLQCQGEHIRSWRNRWFVLKQGYLFRFMNDKVTASAKPRGVVDLSKVQDVKVVPGKGNTIQIKTASGGTVQYMAATETEVVEWVSALEGAVQRICKEIAGVEEEPPKLKQAPAKSSTTTSTQELIKQLERNFESAVSTSSGGSGSRHGGGGNSKHSGLGQTMVSVLGYDAVGRDAPSSSGRTSGRDHDSHASSHTHSPYSVLSRQYSGGYTNIAGSQVMGANTVGANTNSTDLDLNYGGFATRTSSAQPPAYSGGSTSHAPAPQYSAPAAMGHYGGYPGSGSGAAPAQTGGYYAPAQQQAMQQGVSLIDQVPSAAPSYPTYFQHASAPQPQMPYAAPAPAPAPSSWQVHYTGEGKPYYYNPATNVTQWELPVGGM